MRVVSDDGDMIAVSLFLSSGLDNKNDIVWMLEFQTVIPPEMFFQDWIRHTTRTSGSTPAIG